MNFPADTETLRVYRIRSTRSTRTKVTLDPKKKKKKKSSGEPNDKYVFGQVPGFMSSKWKRLAVDGDPGPALVPVVPDHLSPCCVSLCLLRSTFLWKPLPQRSQANGLYPVCFLLCVIRLELWLKAFPHTWHLWGFSPKWNKKKNRKEIL